MLDTLQKQLLTAAAVVGAGILIPVLLTSASTPVSEIFADLTDGEVGTALISFVLATFIGVPALKRILELSEGWKRLILSLAVLMPLGLTCLLIYLDGGVNISRGRALEFSFAVIATNAICASVVVTFAAIVAWIAGGFSESRDSHV